MLYFPLLVASVFLSVTQVYARMTTQRRWRAWLNNHLIDRWFRNGRYYQLNLVSGDHKNPEYRIADEGRRRQDGRSHSGHEIDRRFGRHPDVVGERTADRPENDG